MANASPKGAESASSDFLTCLADRGFVPDSDSVTINGITRTFYHREGTEFGIEHQEGSVNHYFVHEDLSDVREGVPQIDCITVVFEGDTRLSCVSAVWVNRSPGRPYKDDANAEDSDAVDFWEDYEQVTAQYSANTRDGFVHLILDNSQTEPFDESRYSNLVVYQALRPSLWNDIHRLLRMGVNGSIILESNDVIKLLTSDLSEVQELFFRKGEIDWQ